MLGVVVARVTPDDLQAEAVDALARSVSEVGLSISGDQVLVLPDGRKLPLEVVAVAVLDEARAATVARRAVPNTVVVADLISRAGRDVLDRAGVGWLDRRGHLHIVGPGLLIDRNTAPLPRFSGSGSRAVAVRGAASTGVASAQLIWGSTVGVRQLARTLLVVGFLVVYVVVNVRRNR
jgi:hypothetical protein